MTSASVENYLKAIYKLQTVQKDTRVKTKAIADTLDLALPSVTSMLKALSVQGLLDYIPYQGVRLTDDGRLNALKVIRKHRLIELFLMETLGLDWSEVHAEAELLEHAMSEKLTERIDAFLGYPKLDPHGDPIPSREGVMPDALEHQNLCEADLLVTLTLRRVLTQDRDFLTYLNDKGLTLGAHLTIIERAPFGGPITLKVDGQHRDVSLSLDTAGLLLVASGNQEHTSS